TEVASCEAPESTRLVAAEATFTAAGVAVVTPKVARGAVAAQPSATAGPGTAPTSHWVISASAAGLAPSQMPLPAEAMARAWSAAERPAKVAVQLTDPGAS